MIYSYIDPGTGSMLFSLVLGLVTAGIFGFRALLLKLKFGFGKKNVETSENSIPYVIFSDHKRYFNIFSPICDEFEKHGTSLVYYTLSQDDPVFKQNYKYIKPEYLGEGNKPYIKLNMLKADFVISTTPGLDVYQWKRSKNVKCYVHVPHTVDDLSGYRMFGLDFYDTVLTSGENQKSFICKIEELRPNINKKELVTVGSLPLDNLKKQYDLKARKTINEKPVILLAPSWGKSAILSKYGEKLLTALSKTSYTIICRPHPQTTVSEKEMLDNLMAKFPNIEWNFDNDNFDVLNRSDFMITDFSGIIFDYSMVFDKPVIYADTHFDAAPYDADWLDEPMWSLRVLPELGVKLDEDEFENLESKISSVLKSDSLKEGRELVRKECWENIGHSAESVYSYLINKETK